VAIQRLYNIECRMINKKSNIFKLNREYGQTITAAAYCL